MRALIITNSITRRDERSLEKYFNDISKYDVLSAEEEVEMFKKIGNGDEEALLKIVNHNLRFVVSVAKKYQFAGLWLGDLINEGNIGLIKAAKRFDVSKGFKFISYAVWWIRQSILQAVNEKSRKIRLPVNFKSNIMKVMNTRSEILQHEEREPSVEELSLATGLSEEAVVSCMENYKNCTSLDAPVNEENDAALNDLLIDFSVPQPDYDLVEKESKQTEVQQLLDTLTTRQSEVIAMYYGIGSHSPTTLDEISEAIGVTRERVRQIRDRGLRKLRLKAKHLTHNYELN